MYFYWKKQSGFSRCYLMLTLIGVGVNSSTFFFRVAPSLCFKARQSAKTLIWRLFFYPYANETHFHKKGFVSSLVLKVRVFGTRKLQLRDHKHSRNRRKRLQWLILNYSSSAVICEVLQWWYRKKFWNKEEIKKGRKGHYQFYNYRLLAFFLPSRNQSSATN